MRIAVPSLLIASILFPCSATGDVGAAAERARAGQFDTTGEIRCAQVAGQTLVPCDAAVARADGSAVVVVTFPNGFARTLTFSGREFLRGNPTMSGVGTDTDWHRSDGMYHVRVDDQRFEIPEALVFGD